MSDQPAPPPSRGDNAADETNDSEDGQGTVEAQTADAVVESQPGGSTGGITYPDWFDNRFNEAAAAAVPDIDTTWRRWYAPPYRLLGWSVRSWRGQLLPRPVRNRLISWMTFLIRHFEHERNVVHSRDDPMHTLTVPEDEHVTVPTLWVVELFPPSTTAALTRLVRAYQPSIRLFANTEKSESLLFDARAGQGYSWFQLGYIRAPQSRWIVPDSYEENLPAPFDGVDLTAIQLDSGLTAVVGQFKLTEDASTQLDAEWHRNHEPSFRRHGTHLIADDRKWSAFSHTQRVRRGFHDAARNWMGKKCAGVFAQNGQPQPLFDLLILEKARTPDTDRWLRDVRDTLRALGITGLYPIVISPAVPEFALAQVELDLCPTLETERTWALWGNRTEAIKARPGLTTYTSSNEFQALAYKLNDDMRGVFLALAITEMVHLMQRLYTKMRDTARTQHTTYSPAYLQQLRQTLLTLGIDLASARTDVPAWWKRHRHTIPPFFVVHPGDEGKNRLEYTEHLRSRQTKDLKKLGQADASLRDILSTVASLGAARDAQKIGRLALYVAGLSLAVATTTLLFSHIDANSMAAHLLAGLHHLWTLLQHR